MRIEFLGTSHGRPEPNRKCSCILVEVAGAYYFFDMGVQAGEQLITQGIPAEAIRAVFITHMHIDHTSGLPSFLALCADYYKAAAPRLFIPGDTEGVKAGLGAFLACNGITRPTGLPFFPVAEGELYADEHIRVRAYRTKHTDASYAYLIEAEGRRVLISGDLSHRPQEDFPIAALTPTLDLAICECAHFEATEYLPILTGRAPRRLCFTHYSERLLPTVLAMQGHLANVPVMRAQDGTVITL